MVPEEVQAFVRSVKEGAVAAAPATARSFPRRAVAGDAQRALREALIPALADPATRERIAGLQKRLDAEHAAARRREVLAGAERRVDGALIAADLPVDADAVPRWYVLRQPFLIWPTGL